MKGAKYNSLLNKIDRSNYFFSVSRIKHFKDRTFFKKKSEPNQTTKNPPYLKSFVFFLSGLPVFHSFLCTFNTSAIAEENFTQCATSQRISLTGKFW